MASRVRHPATLLLLLALAILSGCIFSPERKKSGPPPEEQLNYLPPISPSNVLQNLITAYVGRDSIETAKIYDVDYVGTSTDLSAPTPLPDFSRATEISHVGRLRRDPNVVTVFLDLGPPATWEVLDASSGDPAGWKAIHITNQTVRIEDLFNATTYQSVDQIIEYTFKPTGVPGAPAAEDTTWTVVRWTEFAN